MAKFYENIASLIKPGRISSAAATLSETEQKVTSAVDIILPSLLARTLRKGDTPEIRAIVEEAGKLKMHNDYNQIWDGNAIFDGKNMGVRMENQLLGTDNPKFYSAVASKSGIGNDNANRLTTWVAGTIAAYLGEKVASGRSYASVLADLGSEKESLRNDIPSNLISILGLGSVLGVSADQKPAQASSPKPAAKKKSGMGWLWWLLGIILLALIIFLVCRSCERRETTETVVVTEQVVTTAPVDNNADWNRRMPQGVAMVLPDGQKVTVYQNSCEECMEAFLKSDKFKNATEAELRTVWFQMSDINFEHNSATELMADGEKQVSNIAAMLKNYPDVKVKVGAFADATGTRAVNYRISEQRALNIEKAFEKAGVKEANISTEGFGEEYANVPAGASDAERAIDRDIALRFTK